MPTLFITFVAIMAAVVVGSVARRLNRRAAVGVAVGLSIWLAYVGCVSYLGVAANTATRPPGIVFVVGPVALLIVAVALLVASPTGGRVALAFPIAALVGTQSFRVGVELFIHQLWVVGLAPKMLTFFGANVDVYVGASAPLCAWLATRGRWGLKVALAWNALGLLALANVVVRAVLTAPGPLNRIHAEVPDLMLGTFPYTFIPGFFVPLAVTLHLLALRNINARRVRSPSPLYSGERDGVRGSPAVESPAANRTTPHP